jgi:energy-coupling factor transporter ATP-binding protein EcfA2
MITLSHITFAYADRPPVLDDISLEIKSGEAVCIMGANGCGKSTLARLIAGLVEPRLGEVIIDHESHSVQMGKHHAFRRVGILFQDPDNQMVAVTVDKEIAFSLENAAVPMATMEQTVTETLAHFGITHLRNRLTSELSGGEKQRVALASVMVAKPPVLLLDEPDSFLDQAGKQMLTDELARMHKADPGLTEIRITQYPQVARQYARMVVLHEGKVAADGRPDAILKDDDLCLRAGLRFDARDASAGPEPCAPAILPDGHRAAVGHPVQSIRLQQISFGYDGKNPVVADLDFTWKRGETIGLVGPSGSGKSSLGSLMCGLLQPLMGRIELLDTQGLTVTKTPKPGWIAGLFQQPERQFFLTTCGEEVAFGPKNLGVTLSPDDIAEYLNLVGLGQGASCEAGRLPRPAFGGTRNDETKGGGSRNSESSGVIHQFASRDPFSLSMGEKRRLAFASVLSMNPSFVVFDEPTCGLDPEGVGRFMRLSQSLRERGIGQLIISHDGDIIRSLSHRVLYLPGDGRAAEMTTEEFFGSPAYRSVVSR